MSAIAAIIRFDGTPVAASELDAMLAVQAHRGPDRTERWLGDGVALGHAMLCTTPESLDERQPLVSDDGTLVVAMHGRVDNRGDLAAALAQRGVAVHGLGDAALVLAAWQAWDSDCLDRIDGDFALVLWDARRRRVICARDRFGMKPLHYHWDGRCLTVASELPAILERPWVPEVLDETAVAQFVSATWWSRTDTLWQDVRRLDAAHVMTIEDGRQDIARYWSPPLEPELVFRSEADCAAHYRAVLFDAVQRQSRSHAPLGCEVSGGLDSSTVFSVAEHLQRDGRLAAPGLAGYTMRFPEQAAAANEIGYAHSVAHHLGCILREIAPTTISWQEVEQRTRRLRDFVGFPNSLMQMGLRAAVAGAGSRVLLTGQGGDEWTTGSLNHLAETVAARAWGDLATDLRREAADGGWPTALWRLARHGLYPLLPEVVRDPVHRLMRENRLVALDGTRWLSAPFTAIVAEHMPEIRRAPAAPWRRVGQREQLMLLRSASRQVLQCAMERDAAGAGLELRDPLYSRPVVEFAFGVRMRWRTRGSDLRHLHRLALVGLLPEDVRLRRAEAEFSVAYDPYVEDLCADAARIAPARASWIKPGMAAEVMKKTRENATFHRDLTAFCLLWGLTQAEILDSSSSARA